MDISLPGLDRIINNQDVMLRPFEKTWVNPSLRIVPYGAGMGTIRQVARLALSRNFDKVKIGRASCRERV